MERITQHPMPSHPHVNRTASLVGHASHTGQLVVVGVLLVVLVALVAWWAITRRRQADRP